MYRWLFPVLLAGCGRIGFDARESASDAPADGVLFGPWSTPQPIAALNTTADDSDPEISSDGLELIFHSRRGGGAGLYDLYRSIRTSTTDAFPAPTPIVELDTAGEDQNPGLTKDGRTIVFSDGADIRFATRGDRTSAFGAVQTLAALSSADVDTCPEISGDGRIAIIVRGTGDLRELWIYTRASDGPVETGWSAGTQLLELSTSFTEASPDLDEHGLVLHFHSNRLGPTDDIFVTTRASANDSFDPPTLVEVSSAADEGDPTLPSDLRTLVFHRMLDLYIATR